MTEDYVYCYTAPVKKFGQRILCIRYGQVVDEWVQEADESELTYVSDVGLKIWWLIANGFCRCLRNDEGHLILYRAAHRHPGLSFQGGVQ